MSFLSAAIMTAGAGAWVIMAVAVAWGYDPYAYHTVIAYLVTAGACARTAWELWHG